MAVVFALSAPGGYGAALPATIAGQIVTGTGTGGADFVFNGTLGGSGSAAAYGGPYMGDAYGGGSGTSYGGTYTGDAYGGGSGSVTVSNAVYLAVPNQGGYHDGAAFRVLQTAGDSWLKARFVYCGTSLGTTITPNQSEQYVNLALRAGTTLIANGSQPNDGYMVGTDYHAAGNAITINKVVGGAKTQLAIVSGLSFNAGARDITVEFWCTGTGTVTLKARQYDSGSPVPDWQVTATDASAPINAAGYPWVIHANGNAAANKAVVVRALTIDDTTIPVVPAPPAGVPPHWSFHHLRRR